jgi:ArsR family transcriptional regulator, arsenate/arsenite/antimonite-responsive transcriptional repressor
MEEWSLQAGDARKLTEIARGLAALAHPRRLEILAYLSARPCCCCKDVVERIDLAQSTVSQHLKVLAEAGLIRCETSRQRSLYAVDVEALGRLSEVLAALHQHCRTGREG